MMTHLNNIYIKRNETNTFLFMLIVSCYQLIVNTTLIFEAFKNKKKNILLGWEMIRIFCYSQPKSWICSFYAQQLGQTNVERSIERLGSDLHKIWFSVRAITADISKQSNVGSPIILWREWEQCWFHHLQRP